MLLMCTGDATLKTSVHQLLLIQIFLFLLLQDIKSSRKAFKGEFSGKEIFFLWGFFIMKKTI